MGHLPEVTSTPVNDHSDLISSDPSVSTSSNNSSNQFEQFSQLSRSQPELILSFKGQQLILKY